MTEAQENIIKLPPIDTSSSLAFEHYLRNHPEKGVVEYGGRAHRQLALGLSLIGEQSNDTESIAQAEIALGLANAHFQMARACLRQLCDSDGVVHARVQEIIADFEGRG